LNQLANGVFHGALFRPQARQRLDARVEKLGIIRGRGPLANRVGCAVWGSGSIKIDRVDIQ
jgi:hypothetical protein